MGTKNNPKSNDGYGRALPDEPLFTLLARDLNAPELVRDWAEMREVQIEDGIQPESDRALVEEARDCASDMEMWRVANDGVWRSDPAPIVAPMTVDESILGIDKPADVPFGDGVFRRRAPVHVKALFLSAEQVEVPVADWPAWAQEALDLIWWPDGKIITGAWLVEGEDGSAATIPAADFAAAYDRVR